MGHRRGKVLLADIASSSMKFEHSSKEKSTRRVTV